MPKRGSNNAAGVDLHSGEERFKLFPMSQRKVRLRMRTMIPPGYCVKIYSRSGLACKSGIEVVAAPTIIDSDFRGAWSIYLRNSSRVPYTIRKNDRVAQMMIEKVLPFEWKEMENGTEFDSTGRNGGAYGSTGR